MLLSGKGIIITGASQGLGKEIARACIEEDADILICARTDKDLEKAGKELSEHVRRREQKVITQVADVSNCADMESIFGVAISHFGRIDGLVNNAGVYGPKGLIEEVDWQEWVTAIEINLMGTVVPCRTAMPLFRKQGAGKIINLSGGGATAPLPRLSAYAAAKAAVVRFTETLAEETRGSGIDVNVIAPGALNARLLEEILAAGPNLLGDALYQRSVKQKKDGGNPLQKATSLAVFLLSEKSNGITGKLLSAVWDPWEELPQHLAEIDNNDIYTLRRIVPKDRGLNWGDKQ